MEDDVVVIAPPGELHEVPARLGCVLVVHLHGREKSKAEYFEQNQGFCGGPNRRQKRGRWGTSTVKGPMDVSRVTSGGPPSVLPHISALCFWRSYCRRLTRTVEPAPRASKFQTLAPRPWASALRLRERSRHCFLRTPLCKHYRYTTVSVPPLPDLDRSIGTI